MEKKITKIGVLLIISLAFIVSMSYAKNADISIENAMISGGYFSWEIHITPTDDWGVGNRKALGDCSWYFDANMNALSGIELTYVAPQVDPSEGYTNTCAITGGHPQVTTDLDYDNYDGVNLTQGVNYHLYTVRMTITDPSAQSDLYWDELNTGIFNAPDQEVIENYIGNGDITLPVELSAFTATYVAENGYASICWTTASETDVNGFNIYRNTADDFEAATRVTNELIPGYGTTPEQHDYIYHDEELEIISGSRYWYWLESIDFGGEFHRHGAIVLTIPDIPDDHPVIEAPIQYGLHQNSPNPISIRNSSTTISFVLPNTALVEVKIYNIRGELVKDLYNGTAYGDVEVKLNWDGRDRNGIEQPTGIYLYGLKVNGKVNDIKRLILQR